MRKSLFLLICTIVWWYWWFFVFAITPYELTPVDNAFVQQVIHKLSSKNLTELSMLYWRLDRAVRWYMPDILPTSISDRNYMVMSMLWQKLFDLLEEKKTWDGELWKTYNCVYMIQTNKRISWTSDVNCENQTQDYNGVITTSYTLQEIDGEFVPVVESGKWFIWRTGWRFVREWEKVWIVINGKEIIPPRYDVMENIRRTKDGDLVPSEYFIVGNNNKFWIVSNTWKQIIPVQRYAIFPWLLISNKCNNKWIEVFWVNHDWSKLFEYDLYWNLLCK